MAGVLIIGLVGVGREVLARRNIGTAPLPDIVWFWRKYFPSEGACFISLSKKRLNHGSIPKIARAFVCLLRRLLFPVILLLNIATLCVDCLVYS
jgi:hypothetical protein